MKILLPSLSAIQKTPLRQALPDCILACYLNLVVLEDDWWLVLTSNG